MTEALLVAVGVIFTAISGGAVGIYTANRSHSANRDATRETGMAAWAEQLRDRIDTLEKRIGDIEDELSAANRVVRGLAVFIDRLGLWHRAGQRGPAPVPPPLIHEHIDTSLWVDRPYDDGLPAVATPPMEAP